MPLPVRLFDLLDAGADQYPDREFAVHGARRLTYGEAVAASRRLARGLVERGLEAGDRVAVLSRNSIEMVLLYFAAARVGVVPVPLNHRLAAPEWRYIVDDARARAVFAAGEYIKAIDGLRSGLPSVERLVALDGAGRAGWQDLPEWMAAAPDGSLGREVRPEHDLYQMYTSGTTGHPKGAVLTHRAVIANAAQIASACLSSCSRLGGQPPPPSFGSWTPPARGCPTGSSARWSRGDRSSCAATGICPRPLPRRCGTAGCTQATRG